MLTGTADIDRLAEQFPAPTIPAWSTEPFVLGQVTVLQVIAERLLLDLVEGRAHGADLGQHVDAVAILLDHAGDAAHLALDAAEPGELGFLQSLIHALNYTPVGYTWQPWITGTITMTKIMSMAITRV